MADLTGALLREAADETDDARDHDELHAAAEVLDGDPVWAYSNEYIKRWIDTLVETHGIEGNW